LFTAACASSASNKAGFEAALDCVELADRRVEIQQGFLDDLGDLPTADLEPAGGAGDEIVRLLGATCPDGS